MACDASAKRMATELSLRMILLIVEFPFISEFGGVYEGAQYRIRFDAGRVVMVPEI